ncbi:MAG: hypothetical protein ACRC2J_15830 [Microcoleaceae cyanobacterium]
MTEEPKTQNIVNKIFSNWRVLVGIVIAFILAMGILVYYWPNLVAVQGMKKWASKVPDGNAQAVECMMRDTNSDGYVSCTALLKEEIVPLECGVSIFNIGCRVSYGSAAPPVKPQKGI